MSTRGGNERRGTGLASTALAACSPPQRSPPLSAIMPSAVSSGTGRVRHAVVPRKRSKEMHRNGNRTTRWKVATIVLLPALALTLDLHNPRLALLAGHDQQGQARVMQVQGTNYVEVNGLARVTGGSL